MADAGPLDIVLKRYSRNELDSQSSEREVKQDFE